MNKQVGQVVRETRETLGMTQEFVADHIGVPRSAVSEIESGKRELSATELFSLAKLFGEPMEHLLGIEQHSPDEDLVMLRAEAVTPETRLELKRFVRQCEQYHELEETVGEVIEPDLRSPRSILATYEQAHKLAEDERKRLDLGVTPAHQLVSMLEDHVGVKVLCHELPDEISGASVRSQRFGSAALVNCRHPAGRQAFTLAHEYFHLLTQGRVARSRGAQSLHLCEAKAPDGRKDRAEQLADQFAAQLLMPRDHFVEQVARLTKSDRTLDSFELIEVARYFGVSVWAVFVRMAALKMVSWDVAKQQYNDANLQDEIIKRGGGTQPEPTRFKRLAVKAFLTEQISRSRLAELLDVNIADVDDEVGQFGRGDATRGGVRITLPR